MPVDNVGRRPNLVTLLTLAFLVGCVDLTLPPPLQERLDASMIGAGAAGGAATGGTPGSGGSGGQATVPAGPPDAGAGGGNDGAAVDAAGGKAGAGAADAAGGVDAATRDLGTDAVDAGDMGGADAMGDVAADVPTSPPDTMADVASADAPTSPADAMADVADAGAPPPTIAFTDASSILYAPGTGGTDFTAPCGGGGQALIGVTGTSGGVVGLNSVKGACGVIEVTGTPSYQLTTRASATLGPYGPVTPTSHDGSCPANQVVVGFEGGSGSWINYLFIYCASLTITGSAGSYTVAVGAPTRLPTRLGTDGATPFAARYCPAGQIAVGMLGGAGSAIDRFGLSCAKPVAQ
jgi:hypothetical protein